MKDTAAYKANTLGTGWLENELRHVVLKIRGLWAG